MKHKLFRHMREKNGNRTTHLGCDGCRQQVIKEEGINKLNEYIEQVNYCLIMNGDTDKLIEKEIEN